MALKYLAACPVMSDIIVSEQGPDSSAKYIVNAYGADYVYAYKSPNEPFCRSECINTALHKVKTSGVVIWDIDCYISYEALRAVDATFLDTSYIIVNSEAVDCDCVIPYVKAHGLTEKASQAITDWKDFTPTDEMRAVVSQFSQPNFAGGIQCFRTETLKHVRGFNESFKGYGQEDNEIINRLVKLGYHVVRHPGELFHRYHSTSQFYKAPYIEQHETNTKKLEDLLKLDKAATLEHFGITDKAGVYVKVSKEN
jgi:predicted glycosyltransferase involved in capsule biosynthesis